jgi:protein-S-isoprenylcysteine O-methyltransferase Ste14
MIVFKIAYWLGMVIEVVIRTPFRNWLDFADYHLPAWLGWSGVAVLAGPATLIVYIPFYIIRVPAEEKLMLDAFGDQYRDYLKKTGALIPRLSKAG